MSEIPETAIDAVVDVFGSGIVDPRELALAILEAAEKAWPHNPPQRDLESTTVSVIQLQPKTTDYYHRHRFGFGKPQPEVR